MRDVDCGKEGSGGSIKSFCRSNKESHVFGVSSLTWYIVSKTITTLV